MRVSIATDVGCEEGKEEGEEREYIVYIDETVP